MLLLCTACTSCRSRCSLGTLAWSIIGYRRAPSAMCPKRLPVSTSCQACGCRIWWVEPNSPLTLHARPLRLTCPFFRMAVGAESQVSHMAPSSCHVRPHIEIRSSRLDNPSPSIRTTQEQRGRFQALDIPRNCSGNISNTRYDLRDGRYPMFPECRHSVQQCSFLETRKSKILAYSISKPR